MTTRLDYNRIAPNGAKALAGVHAYIRQSGLPAELVDLVYLRISQINNCAYCLDTHTRDLVKKGVKIEKLALVQAWAEAGNLFTERERAALAWQKPSPAWGRPACRVKHSMPFAPFLKKRNWWISPSRSA
jgi:AhpD family alkylhydroperoxidase